ncbi:MAG TPA: type II toxin-antitoxin system VapC family toxin [Isosphaeraceae bacterium]
MAIYFFDTSALVKRYVNEVGSAWVDGLIDPAAGHSARVASITGVEVVSAIARRERRGSISPTDAATVRADFRYDFANLYQVTVITPAIVTRAMTLAELHAIRGFDAVQLAVALEVAAECLALGLALTLVSADAELNAAARAEGLAVEDPNAHP